MAMDIKAQAKKMAADKLKSYGGKGNKDYMDGMGKKSAGRPGYAFGGVVGAGGDDGGSDGGLAEGGPAAMRGDRPAPKSKGKSGTVVNVIIAGPGKGAGPDAAAQPPMPPPPPQRVPVPVPAPPMAGPGGPPGPGGPGGPGMMPPMRASGGRVGYKDGGTVGLSDVKKELPKISGRKATPDMNGGAGGGLGRLQKCNDYGKRSS